VIAAELRLVHFNFPSDLIPSWCFPFRSGLNLHVTDRSTHSNRPIFPACFVLPSIVPLQVPYPAYGYRLWGTGFDLIGNTEFGDAGNRST
jgi:hypothetical protein